MNSFYSNLKSVIAGVGETGLATDIPEKLCPECGSQMVVRRSRFGKLFYGCSKFPKCRSIIGID
jgi:DNA topoisomerase-1